VFFAAFFLFLEDAYARTTGQICPREPASGFSLEACFAHPSTWTPASSCDFRNSASRSSSRSACDARNAREGQCSIEPEAICGDGQFGSPDE
jgi:hypothetical protein